MANLSVTNTFSNGTVADASQVNTNYSDIVNFVNNRNTAITNWDGLSVSTASRVPAVFNNSSGANDIAQFQDNGSNFLRVTDGGNTVLGNAALSTSATDGFLNLTSCPGTPTGVPTAYTGRIPIIVDSTNNLIYAYNSGWIGLTPSSTGWTAAGETWTYASATTFTVTGDVTSKYQIGDKIQLTQTTVKYFYIQSVSFSGSTTITITGGTDYTLANAAITSNFFSKEANPQGFPAGFAYTPTTSGWAATPSTTCFFSIQGRTLFLRVGVSGTSNNATHSCALPVASSSTAGGAAHGYGAASDNSANLTTPAHLSISSGSSTVSIDKVWDGSNIWTNSGTSFCFGNITYSI